jgi:hypothetical protein
LFNDLKVVVLIHHEYVCDEKELKSNIWSIKATKFTSNELSVSAHYALAIDMPPIQNLNVTAISDEIWLNFLKM